MSALRCRLDLPAGFRVGDLLKFHQRDAQALAERVAPAALHKGMVWLGQPACLALSFAGGRVEAELAIDGPLADGDLAAHVGRMIGLTQAVEAFEQHYRDHPQLGPLLARQSGLRVALAATPFEALSWAVIGQQISVGAAVAVRRRLIQVAGMVHSAGLACYPDAARLAALSEAELRAAGLSQTKARTLLAISEQVLAGELPLDAWLAAPPVDTIRERLSAIRGVGPWTVNYALLRGFGWLDGSLHGDAAVRRAMQRLGVGAEREGKLGEAEAKAWLDEFAPWRALVGAHLWASLALSA
ncbi:MAG TPA: 3-methyladenine DNA glycosylase 2 [Azonexus sp.]|nr:3-methyladenine DNA glycosylase 2 [Azonexus sp.]